MGQDIFIHEEIRNDELLKLMHEMRQERTSEKMLEVLKLAAASSFIVPVDAALYLACDRIYQPSGTFCISISRSPSCFNNPNNSNNSSSTETRACNFKNCSKNGKTDKTLSL